MLVLSRHKEQKIHIGDDIVITVIKIEPGIVHLGFEAPRDVVIHRDEVYEALERQLKGGPDGTNHQVEK